jgi:hypothetical protein
MGPSHPDLSTAESLTDHITTSVVHPDMFDDGWKTTLPKTTI